MTVVEIPDGLRRNAALVFGATGTAWLERLPAEIDHVLDAWGLRTDLPPGRSPWHGMCGLVLPVRTADDVPAVLKLSPADEGNEHEHTALEAWDGNGAVRLLAADPARRVLLLERLDGDHDLRREPAPEATAELARLLVRLAVPAPPAVARMAVLAETWVEQWPRRWRELAISAPVTLLHQAVAAARELGPDSGDLLIHTDLHYENALSPGPDADPGRGRWLAIDPQPMAGDPAFGITPMLWNRIEDLGDTDREGALRSRLALAAEVAGLDAERARRWSIAREVQNMIWSAEDHTPDDFARSEWVASTLARI